MKTHLSHRPPKSREGGFTLVELMVTVGIAMFLLGGLVTIMHNVRQANLTQNQLTALQDTERFALTVLTDSLQAGGYFADPINQSTASFGAVGVFPAGSAFFGTHGASDTVYTRFMTAPNQGPILCNGFDTTSEGAATDYTIEFYVQNTGSGDQLWCSVNGANAIPLVTGVHSMTIYYGINRGAPNIDYNVDTYVTADQMINTNDWLTVSAIRIVVSFENPLYVAGSTAAPQFITVERVIEVMGRAGVHT